MLYTAEPGLVIGFHGCDQRVSDAIISGITSLRPSTNDWDWLGHGIYFWQNSYDRAMNYAMHPPPNVQIHQPAVIGAVISLGRCLDLTDKRWIDLTRSSFEILKRTREPRGFSLPANADPGGGRRWGDKVLRRLDCAVIENVHKLLRDAGSQPFDSVRCVFYEGKRLYRGAGFYEKTHVQICIRNPNCIKGYFRPREEVDWK
ncbi:hypothetical protein MKQ68_01450 [Chitinophaga horti]|uniref:PARP catalytic domain-containing protein n=1 Tax=Chitinophaga horti TaxID=2920382 RepID=A0ABY6J2M5_9BACT|nr:hypothetical protein [Chitinophaga horti]UYQ93760.1 hypothetical protein MKQ68_01450 [Chitinophaga horti]